MKYQDYLQTEHWEELKKKVYKLFPNKCYICQNLLYLHVHHLYYPKDYNWFKTKPQDLRILCERCHSKYHRQSPLFNDLKSALDHFRNYIKEKLYNPKLERIKNDSMIRNLSGQLRKLKETLALYKKRRCHPELIQETLNKVNSMQSKLSNLKKSNL